MKQHDSYWSNISITIRTLRKGLSITFHHLRKAVKTRKSRNIQDPAYFRETHGINTIQYPHETLPVPDTGRYRLHNEIDDCIVCDKCAKVCPVNCITIEPIKSSEEIGKTSDGTTKRIYAAKFDIDMGKCCFCGLCTTVCPTECLTMTKTYDFSVFDIREHVYEFADMTAEEINNKKADWEEFQKSKTQAAVPSSTDTSVPVKAKPIFKPKIKPPDNA